MLPSHGGSPCVGRLDLCGIEMILNHWGHAPPFEIHNFTCATKCSDDIGTGARPSPGFQPHSTGGVCMCSTICSGERSPFCLGSSINLQSCRSVNPSQIIGWLGEGKCQSGAPGGMCRPARLRS